MSHPITDSNSNRLSDRTPRIIHARYDAAQTTDDNKRHWRAVDGLSAKAANNVAVRRVLRTRARYETDNNSHLTGIVETLANDTVGPGPQLHMLTDDDKLNTFVEEEFQSWADEIQLDEKLRTARMSKCVSGEVFAVFVTNPVLESAVKLDIELVEADQMTDPTWQSETSPQWSDGIFYDEYNNPASYRRLRYHPGDLIWGANPLEFDDIPARVVHHFFKATRPGQRRGIPEFVSALSAWPELRRFCNAVIAAAETAASNAFTLETDASADSDDDQPEAMDAINLEKRMATVLPAGYKLSQTEANQPTTTYPQFVDKKIAEAARCLNMPFTIAALDSSNANLSARYLDSLIYGKTIKIERKANNRFLNRGLDFWLTEAIRIPDFLPRVVDRFPHAWLWPSVDEHADPEKVANAQGLRLRNGTTSLYDECGDEGRVAEKVQQRIARSLGLTVPEYREKILIPNMMINPPPQPRPSGDPGAGGKPVPPKP